MKIRIVLIVAMLCAMSVGHAHDFEAVNSDGKTIYYNIVNGDHVDVTFKGDTWDYTKSYSGDIVIPSEVTYQGVTYPVEWIGENAFNFCPELESIHIPNTVRGISWSGIYNCSSLRYVNFPPSLKSFGKYNCSNCKALLWIDIEDIASWCSINFDYGCNPLEYIRTFRVNGKAVHDLVIPIGVTEIGSRAFYFARNLYSVTIPSTVQKIGASAFSNCDKLTKTNTLDIESWCKISFDDYYSNPLIYAHNLYLNDNLIEDLVIPETVTSISARAFYDALCLKTVTIPESVTQIGDYAFYRCNINAVDYNAETCAFGEHVFELGPAQLTIGENVKYLPGGCFSNYRNLKKVIFNATDCDYMGNSTKPVFAGSEIAEVVVGDNVERIPDYAFMNCTKIATLRLGSAVSEIGTMAFSEDTSIKAIYCSTDIPPLCQDYVFVGVDPASCTVHVPFGCEEAYKSQQPWSRFAIVGDIDTSVTMIGSNSNNLFTVYDICGRCILNMAERNRLSTLPPGLYIINGRKTVIR